ncbi:STAS domain-containing protein [Nocardia sp. NPDC051750]|uniref:STAS domain-containing protein n=1 Tax=Nocardia sp. NPDC051750 TaxID=3364325 RepID=UPI0037897B51
MSTQGRPGDDAARHPDPMRVQMKSSAVPSATVSVPATARARTPADQLIFRIGRRGDIVVLTARGEADAFTLPLWRRTVRAAADTASGAGGAVIIDAIRLDFLSLRTLAALAEDARAYRRDGVEIYLVTRGLHIARIAAADPRTAHLDVRSTVVGALTAIQLHRRTAPTPGPPSSYQPPRIVPEPARDAIRGRTHFRAGETVPGHGGFSGSAAATSLPGRR